MLRMLYSEERLVNLAPKLIRFLLREQKKLRRIRDKEVEKCEEDF